jgi:hypothetical protein
MPVDALYNRRFKVLWACHEQIRHRLDRLTHHLGELAIREKRAADRGMLSVTGYSDSPLPDELRALQRDLAEEEHISPRANQSSQHANCADEWASLERQRRTLKEQLQTIVRIVVQSGIPACSWREVLSHFCFFATPLRAYLLQRCDLLRRTAHSPRAKDNRDHPVGAAAHTAASRPA